MPADAPEDEEVVNDPGAVKLGNFINYYSFHPPWERVKTLIQQVFRFKNPTNQLVLLDVGCNTGDLTEELHRVLTEELVIPHGSCHFLAIDVDPLLIERAKEKNTIETIKYECTNVIEKESKDTIKNYLMSHNVNEFDVSFLFSVTMWIHLNGGDDCLRTFLSWVASVSKVIVIEAQPWKCYRAAVRRLKRAGKPSFPLWPTLKYREIILHDISDIVQQTGFSEVFTSEKSSWGRRISIYVKDGSS